MTAPVFQLRQAGSAPHQLAREAIADPRWLDEITTGLNAQTARIKYGCAKALRLISEERPDLLYDRFDFFRRLLDHPNKILQWEATFMLSHLARVDAEDKFAAIFERFFSPIRGPVMITAANVIRAGPRIARAKPHLADRIAAEVLKVGRARYQTRECRNVALGHAILALGAMYDLLENRAPVLQFVRRQRHNSRPATRNKAERFLERAQAQTRR